MTAPDDVRARFEAWADSRGMSLLRYGNGDYADDDASDAWNVWQAAHADPSVEVRELVEALQKLAAYPLEEFALEGKPERKLFGANDWELHAKDVLDARAALAKFTQEKP